MSNPTTNYQNPLQVVQNDRAIKLLQFAVGNLQLALPVESVRKVIRHLPVYGSGLSSFGIVHVENTEITVVDLYRKLFKTERSSAPDRQGYLILAKNATGETIGIWVAETPTLLDITLSRLRVLPESYRRSDTLSIASHVTVIDRADASMTVFLLDIDRLLEGA
ncbi:chemotaxis protein CheW [Pannus brasiliensis CCIBt3594]|uniref:Chemotaxis protein CheW n=1 Tax=Pannus brasiliensis CCIBt3594 TaxID=1427578 RepID=A0AAW9QYP2_9CHRO